MKALRSRTARLLVLGGILAGLWVGVSSVASASGKGTGFKTTGSATGTIDDSGDVSATVDGTGTGAYAGDASTLSLVGTIATGSGVGTSKATVQATPNSSGDVSGTFETKGKAAISGTFTGSTTAPDGYFPDRVIIYTICTVKFPPLGVQCAVSMAGQVSSYK